MKRNFFSGLAAIFVTLTTIAVPVALFNQGARAQEQISGGKGGIPSGVAGGALTGTYPDPTIANLTTVGSVPYVSATGTLNQDPTVFFWDATNDRLGIGTTAPSTYLNVRGASTDTVNFHDTTPIAANIGAGLLLGGNYLGTTVTTWAAVQSGKNNATSGDYGGYLGLWTRANGSPNSEKMRITSAGNVGIGTPAPGSLLSVNGRASANLFGSETNCSSSAAPAVCAAAAAGSVIIPAAGTDVTVNTTAVTANSQIFAIFDQSLGTKLGVTCNSTTANPHIGARVAGTSFTIHANVSPVTNPACFSYFIIN